MASRRKFLRDITIAAMAAVAAQIPTGREPFEIEIVDIEMDDKVLRACAAVGKCYVLNGQAVAEVSFDAERAMDAITLIDSKGNRYRYRDLVRWLGQMGVDVDGE